MMGALDNLDKPDPPNASKAARLPPIGSNRNAIIEECAQVVEDIHGWHKDYTADPVIEIAAAIRALKDKP